MVHLSHPYMTIGKIIALSIWTLVGKVMSLLFNMLCRFVIAPLPKKSVQFSSVTQLCPSFCDPMDYSTPDFPFPSPSPGACSDLHTLSWWSHPTISSSVTPFSSCLQSFPASGSFPMSQLFASGGQGIEASASASVLPMNIQDLFPLGLTDLISLLSKGLSRVFSSTKIQRHQFFGAQLYLWSNSHIHTWLLEKP